MCVMLNRVWGWGYLAAHYYNGTSTSKTRLWHRRFGLQQLLEIYSHMHVLYVVCTLIPGSLSKFTCMRSIVGGLWTRLCHLVHNRMYLLLLCMRSMSCQVIMWKCLRRLLSSTMILGTIFVVCARKHVCVPMRKVVWFRRQLTTQIRWHMLLRLSVCRILRQ